MGEPGRGVCWGRRRPDRAAWARLPLSGGSGEPGNCSGLGRLGRAGLRGSSWGRGLDARAPRLGARAGGVRRFRPPSVAGLRATAGAREQPGGGSRAVITGGAAGGGGRGSGAGPEGRGLPVSWAHDPGRGWKRRPSQEKQAAQGLEWPPRWCSGGVGARHLYLPHLNRETACLSSGRM